MDPINITTPVGRIVQGSLYDPQTTDADNKPLVIKSGPNIGQPRVSYYFALAIPKGAEVAAAAAKSWPASYGWALTEWGSKIYALGHASNPQAAQRPDFAWKITDGDSAVPNKLNRKPCDGEGFPGHWILRLSSSFAPKMYTLMGVTEATPLEGKNAIVPGYWAQVATIVAPNNDTRSPGLYLNHSMVCLIAFGAPITFGPDVKSAGFGNTGPLPQGATATPPAGFTAPVAPTPAVAPVPAAATAPMPAPPVAPTPVAPHPGILAVPAAPGVAPAPPHRKMTAKAAGVTYEAYLAAGWTDALLVQHGMLEDGIPF